MTNITIGAVDPTDGALRVYVQSDSPFRPGLVNYLVRRVDDTVYVWTLDPMEEAGIPAPRPPWARLFAGKRWVPSFVINSVMESEPDGREYQGSGIEGWVDDAMQKLVKAVRSGQLLSDR